MRESVDKYLKRKAYSSGKKLPAVPRSMFKSLDAACLEENQSLSKSEDDTDTNEELALEQLLQGHSHPRFYFKNLSF